MQVIISRFVIAVTLLLGAGCGEDARKPIHASESVGELRNEVESMRAVQPERETSDRARKRRLKGVSEWNRPIPSQFLLPKADLVRWQLELADANPQELNQAQHRVTSEMTTQIAKKVWSEMNSISPDFPYPYDQIHPLRAGWILTWDGEAQIDINGIDGYFGNDAYEAPLAVDAFELYGMADRARIIRDAIELWPDDAPLDQYPPPLDGAERKRLSALQDAFWSDASDPYTVRAFFALEHPEYFFKSE